MINKDFGTDYTLNASFVVDVVSGASQNYYDSSYNSDGASGASATDTTSGASALARGIGIDSSNVAYGNVDYDDTRVAGSLLLTKRFENRDELTVGASYSTEASGEYLHWLDSSKNRSVSFGISYQMNEILKHCSSIDGCSGASESMDAIAINTQLGFSQNIDSTSSAKVALFFSNDDGYLDNPYLNVVRNYVEGGSADIVGEKRPDTKTAYGISTKYAKALSDNFTLHLDYRYYSDDWGIDSRTLSGDTFYEFGDDLIFELGLRGYTQTKADFYNGSKDYFTDEIYASSDSRLSDFNAFTYKGGVNYKINKELEFNFTAEYYTQTTGLDATYFMTGFRYNF